MLKTEQENSEYITNDHINNNMVSKSNHESNSPVNYIKIYGNRK